MKFIFLLLKKILPVAFWVLLIFGFDSAYAAILTILAALIHEGGHLIFSLSFSHKRNALLKSDLSGFRIRTKYLSYKEELIAAIGGPIANLAVGLLFLFFPFGKEFEEYATAFGVLNIMTMVSNLLPIEGYDGYKTISAISSLIFRDNLKTDVVLYWVSFVFSCIMTFLSLYLMLRLGEGYWIFAVFFSVTLSTIIRKQNNTIYENK